MLSERVYGDRYESTLTTTQIAARIRLDIAAGLRAGFVPSMKVSVRSSYYSGGSSIYVTVKQIEMARDDRHDGCSAAWAHEPGQGCCLCEVG